MALTVRMDARLAPPERVMRRIGVDKRGRVQSFLTARVLLRMRRYMPWLSGTTATALTTQQGAASIVVNAPYARYLYMGSKMRDPNGGGPYPLRDEDGNPTGEFRYRKGAHPVATGEPLSYTRTVNPYAGDHWDRTLVHNEGAAIAREVSDYARGLSL
jgi:hypothetical protein